MAYPQGINFRATLGYVSDGANESMENCNGAGGGVSYPRTTAQGNTVGWEAAIGNVRDRTTGNDRRLAGINYTNVSGLTFRLDLPSAGGYNIRAAFGDASSVNPTVWSLLDTTTVLAALSTGTNGAPNSFKDANNVAHTAANWPANNTARAATFSTTICRFRSDDAGANLIAHVYVEAAAGSPVRTGTLAASLGGAVGSGAGAVQTSGQSANSLAGVSLAATGTATATSQASNALSGIALASATTATANGATSTTLDGMSSTVTGAVDARSLTAGQLGSMSLSATATASTGAVAAATIGGITSAAAAAVAASGTAAASLTPVTLSATATPADIGPLDEHGAVAAQLADCTAEATATTASAGQAAITLGVLSLATVNGVRVVAGAQIVLGGLQLVARASGEVFAPSALRTYRFPPENRRYRFAPENRKFKFSA